MSISYELETPQKGNLNVRINDEKEYTFEYPCVSLFDCTPYKVKFSPGYYILETWGAQGGSYNNGNGGKGGYSKGTIFFKQVTNGYLYIGGQGTATRIQGQQNGGYNGGGNGHYRSNSYGSGGGGATDIRLLSNTLYHRVIVSGGGGGSGYGYSYTSSTYDSYNSGGYGGGEKGADSTTNPSYTLYESYGGTQTNPGDIGTYKGYRIAAAFGAGGSNTYSSSSDGYSAPGGGAGWFGGGAPGAMGFGAAGGSGYLLTANSYKPPNYQLNSEYYLTNTSYENGLRSGNGMIKITVVTFSVQQIKNYQMYCSQYFFLSPILLNVLSIAVLFEFS